MNHPKYGFQSGVTIAYGVTGSCIYDLRNATAKIYRLDKEATDLVRLITTKPSFTTTESCTKFVSELVANAILVEKNGNSALEGYIEGPKQSFVAWIEVTENCQLSCSYCYGSFGKKKKTTISETCIDMLVEQLKINGFTVFRLIGGEPLIYKQTVQTLVSKLSSICESKIELYTNGLLLTKEFLAFCKDNNVKLAIGIFGANEIECSTVTGAKNVWTKHYDIINLVRASGVSYRISITRTGANSSASNEQLASIYKFPVERLRQDHVKSVGRAKNNARVLQTSSKAITKEYFSRKFPSALIRKNIVGGHPCYENKLCITSALYVHPCIMERSVVYGNLLSTPLAEIVRAGTPYMSASKDSVAICRDCEYRYACFDCRVERVSPDDFYSKSSNCGYNPHTGIWVDQ